MRVAGEPVAGNSQAKWLQLWGALRGRYDAQAVVLTALCQEDCVTARAWLTRYAGSAAELLYERAATSGGENP
jgi:hypothetical protein